MNVDDARFLIRNLADRDMMEDKNKSGWPEGPRGGRWRKKNNGPSGNPSHRRAASDVTSLASSRPSDDVCSERRNARLDVHTEPMIKDPNTCVRIIHPSPYVRPAGGEGDAATKATSIRYTWMAKTDIKPKKITGPYGTIPVGDDITFEGLEINTWTDKRGDRLKASASVVDDTGNIYYGASVSKGCKGTTHDCIDAITKAIDRLMNDCIMVAQPSRASIVRKAMFTHGCCGSRKEPGVIDRVAAVGPSATSTAST